VSYVMNTVASSPMRVIDEQLDMHGSCPKQSL
jgi:hypothetical protein